MPHATWSRAPAGVDFVGRNDHASRSELRHGLTPQRRLTIAQRFHFGGDFTGAGGEDLGHEGRAQFSGIE